MTRTNIALTSLTAEITTITANIDTLKTNRKEKKVALKAAQKGTDQTGSQESGS